MVAVIILVGSWLPAPPWHGLFLPEKLVGLYISIYIYIYIYIYIFIYVYICIYTYIDIDI